MNIQEAIDAVARHLYPAVKFVGRDVAKAHGFTLTLPKDVRLRGDGEGGVIVESAAQGSTAASPRGDGVHADPLCWIHQAQQPTRPAEEYTCTCCGKVVSHPLYRHAMEDRFADLCTDCTPAIAHGPSR